MIIIIIISISIISIISIIIIIIIIVISTPRREVTSRQIMVTCLKECQSPGRDQALDAMET